jgi:hypothetical protein
MKIKFKTFNPYQEHDYYQGKYTVSATSALNKWLEENPNVEIISWQTTAVGTTNELYITIQYTEKCPTTSVCSGGCP